MAYLTSLVAYYNFNEGSTGTAIDSVGVHNLTDNNTVTSNTGIGGTGLSREFTYTNSEYFSAANHADFKVSGDFSFAGWAYFTDVSGANGLSILANTDDFSSQRNWYIAGNTTVLQMQVTDSSSGNSFAQTGGVFSANTWYFIVGTYTASDKIARVYVNNGAATAGSALTNGPHTSTAAFAVGAIAAGGGNFMAGRQQYFGFWQRLLDSTERTFLYNAGAGRSYADLVAADGSGSSGSGSVVGSRLFSMHLMRRLIL